MPLYIKEHLAESYKSSQLMNFEELSLNGYYRAAKIEQFVKPIGYKESISIIDTFYLSFLFDKNGYVIADPSFQNYGDSMYFIRKLNAVYNNDNTFFSKNVSFGYYGISGDTLRAIYVHKPYSWNDGWQLDEAIFLKISSLELQLIARNIIRKNSLIELHDESEVLNMTFIPDSIPIITDTWFHRFTLKMK